MSEEERNRIGSALMIWVSCGYNGAKASEIAKVNYFTLNKWINTYYTTKKRSEETKTLTIPSKV